MMQGGTARPGFPPVFRWLIWGSLLMAVGVYLVVVQVSGVAQAEERDPDLVNILYVMGGISVFISMGIKFVVKRVRTPEGKPKVPTWIDQGYIMALALAESSAIFGLILAFQGNPPATYLPLFGMAVVALGLNAPALFFPKVESA